MTDNSFKLFASPPTPGTSAFSEASSRRPSDGRAKSETQLKPGSEDSRRGSAPSTRQSSDGDSTHHHHHRHHHHQDHTEDTNGGAPLTESSGPRIDAPAKEVLKGPWRLLRLLPRESRIIIGLMLELDPKRRATLEDLMNDPWMSGTPVCRQMEGGRIVKAEGHKHTLEQDTTVSAGAGKD